MAITKTTVVVTNISDLSSTPNATEGLTAAQLQEKFDKTGSDLKTYINDTLTAELDVALTARELTSNKVTSITSSSTDTQYPSAKCVYGAINPTLAFNKVSYSNGAGAYTTNSTTYAQIDATNVKNTVTIVKGRKVEVELMVGGLYTTNTGYVMYFDIGLDGTTTKSNSGEVVISPANYIGNMAADGNSRVEITRRFYFNDITAASHTFYPLWKSSNAGATATIGQYATIQINVREILD